MKMHTAGRSWAVRSDSENALGAWHVVSPRSGNGHPDGESKSLERGLGTARQSGVSGFHSHVVVVLASDVVDVEGDAGRECERLQQMRDHLSRY